MNRIDTFALSVAPAGHLHSAPGTDPALAAIDNGNNSVQKNQGG